MKMTKSKGNKTKRRYGNDKCPYHGRITKKSDVIAYIRYKGPWLILEDSNNESQG